MGSAIAEIVPIAIGAVLINPLPIMAVIIKLFSPRGMATAVAFVTGWTVGLLVAFGVLLFTISPEPYVGDTNDPSTFALVVKLLVGFVLLVLALRQWQKRPGPDDEPALPGWMQTLEQATPLKALGFGAFLSGLNPKNLALIISAALTIAQADLTIGQTFVPVVIYVLLASIGVAVPLLWYAVARERAARTLTAWRAWLTANYSTLMAVVLLLFGLILAAQGVGGLLG